MKTKHHTIQSLRQAGWKVAVHRSKDVTPSTRIVITDPLGYHAQGYACTNPLDNYNRKLGNKIALGRALDNYNRGEYCEFELGEYNV